MTWTPGAAELLLTYSRIYGSPPLIRDIGLLQSSVERPRIHLFGQEQYPTLHLKAAALVDSLSRNHCLVDGNKRVSWISARLAYFRNEGLRWGLGDDAAYDLVLRAAGSHIDLKELAALLEHGFTEKVQAKPS